MLSVLTQQQLDAIAHIAEDGSVVADTEALSDLLGSTLAVEPPSVALTVVDYDQHPDGTPEPNTRTVRGIAWVSLEDDRCHKWSFRTDGLALSTSDEGEQPCPISEDAELVERAIRAVASQYHDSIIKERSARIEALLPDGKCKQIRVVVVQDPRVARPDDVLGGIELIAYRAGRLGIALVRPLDNGQAEVRTIGC